MNNAKVTVLMPVYNGAKYLKKSIESILNQTVQNFEFLIINDGSTDESLGIIQSFQDSRINLINNEKNIGLIKTLNKGLALATTKYIARMDQDDISLNQRLEKQVQFMEKNPQVGICGTWLNVIKTLTNENYIQKYPTNPEEIKVAILYSCPVAHPALIFRKEFFDKFDLKYNENYIHAEDYELWSRAIQYFDFANLPEPLLNYYFHDSNISVVHQSIQLQASNKIRRIQLEQLTTISDKENELYINSVILQKYKVSNKSEIELYEQLLLKLISSNKEKSIYSDNIFQNFICRQWLNICRHNQQFGLWIYKKYFISKLFNIFILAKSIFKLLLKYIKAAFKAIIKDKLNN